MKTFNALSLAVLLTVSTASPLLASSYNDLTEEVRSKTISASYHVTPLQNPQHSLLTDSIDYLSQYRVVKSASWIVSNVSYYILPGCIYNVLHNGYSAVKNWLYGPSIIPHTPTDHNCNLNSEPQLPIEKPQTPVPPRPVCDGGSEGTVDKDKQADGLKPSCKDESDWTVVTYKKHRKKALKTIRLILTLLINWYLMMMILYRNFHLKRLVQRNL